MPKFPVALLVPLLLFACATFPEVDRAELAYGGVGPEPELVPLEGLLAATQGARTTEATQAALDARAARLRIRAAAMRAN